jgi:hypothetical protein
VCPRTAISIRTPARLAAATALAFCLSLPATAMALPQIGDLPDSAPPAQPQTKIGDTPSDYPGTSGAAHVAVAAQSSAKIGDTPSDYPGTSVQPHLTIAAHTATPPIQQSTIDAFDWTDALIGAGGATVLLVILGGGTLAGRRHVRARPLA